MVMERMVEKYLGGKIAGLAERPDGAGKGEGRMGNIFKFLACSTGGNLSAIP